MEEAEARRAASAAAGLIPVEEAVFYLTFFLKNDIILPTVILLFITKK